MTAAAQPPWKMRQKPPVAALRRDLDVDVTVIGAGIAGLTTAYLLARDRRRVAVLDAAGLGAGMTAATTGHLSSAIDARYFKIESAHGEAAARIVAESHTAAIDAIEEIVRRERIDCGFCRLPGYLFAAMASDGAELERELAAARRAGLQVSLRDVPAVGTGRCVEFPRQGQFEPLRYLAGLASAFRRLGGRIYRVRAERVTGGAQPTVSAGGRGIRSRAIVVATNAPFNDRLAVHLQQTSKMTYAIGLRARRGAVPSALYWDTADPYHYIRVEPMRGLRGALPGWAEDELVIVGGNDHRTGSQPEEPPHASLRAWARRHIPQARAVAFRWGGEIREAFDGLAFIGRNPLDEENVYIVSGDCGMGLTHGTIAGLLLSELVAGRDHPWREVYDPRRIRAAAALDLLREGAQSALRFADRILPATTESLDAIRRGAGAVVQRGAHKIAVFRDDDGRLHQRSAVCPHLGCVVAWNAAEQSWDCPCHGSRFSSRGQVFAAPANRDLDRTG